MGSFEVYLQAHAIDPVQLSVYAKVRYMTIWNAMKGTPITAEHAQRIRAAVHMLTGEAYTGDIATQTPVAEQPTLPIRRLKLLK